MSRENLARDAWAAIRAYAQETNRSHHLHSDPSVMDMRPDIANELIGDLIGDLLHLATRNALDVEELLGTVSEHFYREKRWEHAGTVSFGTLRNEDLLHAFAGALEDIAPRRLRQIVFQDVIAESEYDVNKWVADVLQDDMHAGRLLDELSSALNDVAPVTYYFGTLEGDAAHFGFWRLALEERGEEIAELSMAGAI
ncbi:hypothetical protein ACFWAP_00840 [Streptomyces goshikiensis]|uniref:hypothetical protein n=1 Tax=Streptomyces goshikiensis TaxID=1942 RepID=UPI00365DB469